MKVIISRTSSRYYDEDCPVPGAIQERATYLHYRTVGSLEEARERHWGAEFFATGLNHRVDEKRGMVVRDDPGKLVWTIEIDDIYAFFEAHGDLVIERSDYKEYPYAVEIYDSWRE